jgi:hypothetical protein
VDNSHANAVLDPVSARAFRSTVTGTINFMAHVQAITSPSSYSWLFQFGGRARKKHQAGKNRGGVRRMVEDCAQKYGGREDLEEASALVL